MRSLSRIPLHPPASAFLQAKLAVSPPGDALEQEADRVAAHVMRMPAQGSPTSRAAVSPPALQRKCACGGSCPRCRAVAQGRLEEHAGHEEHPGDGPVPVLRKLSSAGVPDPSPVPPVIAQVLRSPGEPLAPSVRAFMEPRFGRSFAGVRVHTGPRAAQSAESIFARAFTSGRNIVFAPGQYRPETPEGRQLLAHELAHVIQQQAASPAIQRAPDPRWAHDVNAARYRGGILANRIRRHGLVSRDVEAKLRTELAYFQGEAHDAYRHAVEPAIREVTPAAPQPEIEMEPNPPSPPTPPPPPPPPPPKACSRLPDASGGKKCKFYVYDSTLPGALGVAWKRFAIADAKFRFSTYALPSGETIEEMLETLLSVYADEDCDCTDEIQFWGHGSTGNGGWISNSGHGTDELSAKLLNIPDVDKYGDDRSVPGYQEWYSKLSTVQRRLVLLRRTICDSDSTIYFRSCQAFKGTEGKEFARASSAFFRCDVSGHTKSIGLTQPGKHTLSVCQQPDWSDDEGKDEESKKDKQKLREIKPK